MPVPEVGQSVPDFTLNEYQNGITQRLSDVARNSPTLLAFFKRSCATSRMALPFVERLHQAYPALHVLGVSQDDVPDTQLFVEQTGLTFPVLLDSDWTVSTDYDLFTVPSVFLLEPEGRVARVNMGWSREQYNALAEDAARLLDREPIRLVSDEDKVPAFRPG
jgi:peroxiredoxin